MQELKFDNQMKKDFIGCARAYYNRHELGLVPIEQAKRWPLDFGLAGHKGLEDYYRTWMTTGKKDAEVAMKGFLGEFKEDQPGKVLKSGKMGESVYTRTRGAFLMQEYVEYYEDDDFEVLGVEIGAAEELADGMIYCGRIDLTIGCEDGVRSTDHKFTGRMDLFTMNPNNQFMGYQWLGEKYYDNFVGMVGDLVGVYKSKPMEECLDRQYERYNKYQMEEWVKETKFVGTQIRLCRELGVWVKNTDHCRAYGGTCVYSPLCTSVNKEGEERLRESMFRVEFWEPYKETKYEAY